MTAEEETRKVHSSVQMAESRLDATANNNNGDDDVEDNGEDDGVVGGGR